MSAKVETKKFGKGERSVPHHSEKAQKWYPAEDDAQPRKVCFDCTPGISRLFYLVRSGTKIEGRTHRQQETESSMGTSRYHAFESQPTRVKWPQKTRHQTESTRKNIDAGSEEDKLDD